jgi:TRAP-type C4-dicarboxylate transport system substrate-binding protein
MRNLKLSCMALAVVMFTAICLVGALSAQPAPIKIAYSTLFPPTHKIGVMTAEWGKEIERKTNGRVKLVIFYSSTLTTPDKAYDGVVKGVSDAAVFSPSFNVGKFPLTEVFDYPLGYTSSQQATKVVNEYLAKFKPKEFNDVKILYAFANSPLVFHTNKPINKMEDLKGLKIRSTGTTARVMSAFGATPVALSIAETYDALSRGVIDSLVGTVEALHGFKFAEVTKDTTIGKNASFTLIQIIIINKAVWDKIPKDAQTIIEEVSKEYADKTAKAYDELDMTGKEFATKAGHKFIQLSSEENAKFANAAAPLIETYVKEKKQMGLPADEVLKFCQERLK